MQEFILENLSTYGPFAVFVLLLLSGFGVPVGEEWVLIPAGALIYSGKFEFFEIAVLAYCGIILADIIWYSICYHYGTPLLHKRWVKRVLHPRRLLQIKHQIERRGIGVIIAARFVPATRSAAITMGGILHMPFWKFLLAEMSCVLITVPIQLGIGYFAAKGLAAASQLEWMFHIIGGAILLLLIACITWVWYVKRRRNEHFPRARMAWLRRRRWAAGKTTAALNSQDPSASTQRCGSVSSTSEEVSSNDDQSSKRATTPHASSGQHRSTQPAHR